MKINSLIAFAIQHDFSEYVLASGKSFRIPLTSDDKIFAENSLDNFKLHFVGGTTSNGLHEICVFVGRLPVHSYFMTKHTGNICFCNDNLQPICNERYKMPDGSFLTKDLIERFLLGMKNSNED